MKFFEACFMVQHTITFCKCPVCAWKECASVFVGCSVLYFLVQLG